MSIMKPVKPGQLFMGKLAHGCDLLEEITNICIKEDIKLARIEALGAVQKACIGYYDQNAREYQFIDLDQHLEITNLVGNISLKDGNPIAHAHITFADSTGKAFGGHLAPGTIVFACELILEALEGPDFTRGLDEETGLPLWSMPE
jgi:predicted DNA-binding protein with PD1-like motif